MARDIAMAIGGDVQSHDGYMTVGRDDVVTFCIGHLLTQAGPEAYDPAHKQWDLSLLPIAPQRWLMEPAPKTSKQLKVVGKLVRQARSVVNCGDAAREGQMIVDEILDHFDYEGPADRLWLQEMNTSAIRTAISRMKSNGEYQNLYASALARSRADWLIGMNLTRAYTMAWQTAGNRGPLHIGRVQTPTLCMVVQRDLDIEAFVPEAYYLLKGQFKHKNGLFTAQWSPNPAASYLDDNGRVKDLKLIRSIATQLSGKPGVITAHATSQKKQQPPLPFSLGDLQKAVNKMFGLSPSQTLDIAQALYEKHKLTTYPRTDYSHLPEDEHRLAPGIIDAVKQTFGDEWNFPGEPDFSLKSPAWNSAKIGDHHGIRPTNAKGKAISSLSNMERAIYELIVRHFLAQFYPPYVYDSTSVTILVETEAFKVTGTVEVDPGWKVLMKESAKPKSDEEGGQQLPPMQKDDPCQLLEARVENKKTSPPPRFDGASLIDAMEKAYMFVTDPKVKPLIKETGIGTPATRAKIVDNLVERNYVVEAKEGKRKVYKSTPRGRALFAAVPDHLRKPDLTAYFEELLKAIERGEASLDKFVSQQLRFIDKLLTEIREGGVSARIPVIPQEDSAKTPARASRGNRSHTAPSRGNGAKGSSGSSANAFPI